jgi:hypothetical protein
MPKYPPTELIPTDALFKVGEIVCHRKRPRERYEVILPLKHSTWVVRKGDRDEEETVMLNEFLSSCRE